MLSLSDNEFSVLNFLVRNFTERLTIRNIAHRLKFSPAGVHQILKKLEKLGIVHGEKLGTGLFYRINLSNKTAYYLTAAVLVGFYDIEIKKIPFASESANLFADKSGNFFSKSKAILFDSKNALFVVDNISSQIEFDVPNVNVIVKTEDEFVESIRGKDSEILDMLRNSAVVHGEQFVIGVIKRFTEGF